MDWRKTITGLLNKAEDPATTPAERDALNDKAAFLMAKYGITERLASQSAVEAPEVKTEVFVVDFPYKTHKAQLLDGLAKALGGQTVQSGNKMYVFGQAGDIERIAMLYTSLLLQGMFGLAAAEVPAYEHGKTYRHTWLLNFVRKVVERVKIAAARAKSEAPGTDLVLANAANVVARAAKAYFPHTSSSRYRYSSYSRGTQDGTTAGTLADIGQTRMGGSVRSLPAEA